MLRRNSLGENFLPFIVQHWHLIRNLFYINTWIDIEISLKMMLQLYISSKEGAKPTLKNMLLGRRVIGEMLLERIPLNDVPVDSVGASNWLHENYRHKVCY